MTWIARAIWFGVVLSALMAIWLAVRPTAPQDTPTLPVFHPIIAVEVTLIGLGYATSGLLILHRRSRHLIGWLLLGAGLSLATVAINLAIGSDPESQGRPIAGWAQLVGAAAFWPAIVFAGPGVALVFPDGRLPSRNWRWPVIVCGVTVATTAALFLFKPGPVFEGGAPNPLGADWLPAGFVPVMEMMGFVALLGLFAASIAAVMVRFARSQREQRAQLKWLTFAVILAATLFVVAVLVDNADVAPILFASLLFVPAAIVIAITRYRLYEIDTLINRTVAYLVLIGIVAGLYAGMIVLLQRIFVLTTGNTSDAAAIISALILATLLHPIRKLIEGVVDRRFKPAPAPAAVEVGSPTNWTDPRFEAAVERVVRRVLREEAPPQ